MIDTIKYNMQLMMANIKTQFNIPKYKLQQLFLLCAYNPIYYKTSTIQAPIYRDIEDSKYILLTNIYNNHFYALKIRHKFD